MVRTMEEWAQHPQAAAIASLPLMEIIKLGDSPPEALPAGSRPLSGIRLLDLTRVLAGPSSSRTMAEHGADVLKITAAHLPNIVSQDYDTGHGKLSTQLDLRQQAELDTLKGLVREAAVFTQIREHEAFEVEVAPRIAGFGDDGAAVFQRYQADVADASAAHGPEADRGRAGDLGDGVFQLLPHGPALCLFRPP